MKQNCRIPALFLLAASLLIAATGCGDTTETKTEDDSAPVSAAETEAVTEESYPAPDTSNLDYGGKTFTAIAPQWNTMNYCFTDELDGDALNDAIYNRISATENALNVDFQYVWSTDQETHTVVKQSIMAGDDAYQLVFTHSVYGLSDYVTDSCLYNIEKLPHIDLNAPWWDKSMMEQFRLGGNLYYLAGDLVIQCCDIMVFNKQIANENDMPDHYQLVRDGKWTWDVFYEEARSVSADTNGDGAIDYLDRSGFAGDLTEDFCSLTYSVGERCTNITDDGIELAFWSDKMVEVFNKAYEYFLDPNVCQGFFRHVKSENVQYFEDGLALFDITGMRSVAGLREYDVDFGILPLPKYDEQQEDYITYAWPKFACVPTTITDPDMTGAVVEQFCYNSTDVLNAYNEILIRGKSVRDTESLEMIDLINSHMAIDVGGSFLGFDDNFHKIFYCFYEMFSANNNNIASFYAKSEAGAQKSLDKLYEQIMAAVENDG